MQNLVKNFNILHDINVKANNRVIDLSAEIGDLSKQVLKSTNYGKEPLRSNAQLEIEVGDILYSLLSLANEMNMNAQYCLTKSLDKIEKEMRM